MLATQDSPKGGSGLLFGVENFHFDQSCSFRRIIVVIQTFLLPEEKLIILKWKCSTIKWSAWSSFLKITFSTFAQQQPCEGDPGWSFRFQRRICLKCPLDLPSFCLPSFDWGNMLRSRRGRTTSFWKMWQGENEMDWWHDCLGLGLF